MTMEDNKKFNKQIQKKESSYQPYDNYDAIEVPYVNAIPSNYEGVMGVPISFLGKYNPDQFEIVWLAAGFSAAIYNTIKRKKREKSKNYEKYLKCMEGCKKLSFLDKGKCRKSCGEKIDRELK
jgi:hypothetical protein